MCGSGQHSSGGAGNRNHPRFIAGGVHDEEVSIAVVTVEEEEARRTATLRTAWRNVTKNRGKPAAWFSRKKSNFQWKGSRVDDKDAGGSKVALGLQQAEAGVILAGR